MRRPLHHADLCPDCDGEGGTFQEDWDGEAPRKVFVDCEGCASTGLVSSCDRCDEPMAASTAELVGYICAGCTDRGDRQDQADALAEYRRFCA